MQQRKDFIDRLRGHGLGVLLLVSLSFLPAHASVHALSRSAKFVGKEAGKGVSQSEKAGRAFAHAAKKLLAQIF